MKEKFPIFKPNSTIFKLTKGTVLLLSIIICILLKNYINNSFFNVITITLLLIGFLFHLTKSYRYSNLNGKLEGHLIFQKDGLIINDRKINIQDITKINIRINDYEGLVANSTRGYQHNMSNGTDNFLDITISNTERIKLFFQMGHTSNTESIIPFFEELITIHKIPDLEEGKIFSVNEYFKHKRYM